MHKAISPLPQSEITADTPITVPANADSPSIRFDWRDWLPYFEDVSIPDDQKQELIETLWAIVLAFVDLGFEVTETPKTGGQDIDLAAVLRSAVLNSAGDGKINPLSSREAVAHNHNGQEAAE